MRRLVRRFEGWFGGSKDGSEVRGLVTEVRGHPTPNLPSHPVPASAPPNASEPPNRQRGSAPSYKKARILARNSGSLCVVLRVPPNLSSRSRHSMASTRDTARRNEVRRLFQTIYPNGTAVEVLTFFAWLEANSPDLLPPDHHGDQFQLLKSDLEGLLGQRPPVKQKATSRRPARTRRQPDEQGDLTPV